MGHDQAQNKVTVIVPKEGAYEKRIVMSCNVAYPDDDALNFHWDLITWMSENVSGWRFMQTDRNIIFTFDNQEDAALFKLTYV